MGWRPFCDLTGDELAARDVHELTVALDGDTFREFMVGARPADELLDQLGQLLVHGIAARVAGDEPLDPGPLHEPNDAAPNEGYGDDSPTPADAADGEAAVDESAEEQPAVAQPIESSQVTTVPTPDESAEDPPAAPQPAVGQDTAGPDHSTADWSSAGRDPAVAEPADAPTVGEAERGRPTDSVIRRWNTAYKLTRLPAGRKVPTWLREQYERLDGAAPDDAARNVAAYYHPDPDVLPARPATDDTGSAEHARAASLAMAERMLGNRSTPRAVADATGLDITEVADLERELRGKRRDR